MTRPQRSRALSLLGLDLLSGACSALVLEGFTRLWLLEREGALGPQASLTLLGVQLMLQGAAALVLWPARVVASTERTPGWLRVSFTSLWFGVPAAYAGYRLGLSLTAGAWIATQPVAPALRYGSCGLFCSFVVALALAWLRPAFSFPRLRLAATFGIAACCAVAHARLYPGQYPEAHLACVALAGLCLAFVSHDLLARARLHRPFVGFPIASWLSLVVTAGCVALALSQERRVMSELLMGSDRATLFVGTLLPAFEDNALRSCLAAMPTHLPYQAPPPRARHPRLQLPEDTNVLLVVVDAMRADTLKPARDTYPGHRFTSSDTPFLDTLVARSFRFERAYAQGTMTHLSMPALFGSRDAPPFDAPRAPSLASLMASLGRLPVAVVPAYFVEQRDAEVRDMLKGFASVSTYARDAQNEQRGLLAQLLAQVHREPFFAWIHYYALHEPGWAGRALRKHVVDWPSNYPKALRWLDGEIRALFAMLERLHIADRTLVVLTADHGEGLLDDGGYTHGRSASEEVSRVPLTLLVPSRDGRIRPRWVPRTVGNIDVVPTVLELLGGMPRGEHRGQSLVPVLLDDAPWHEAYTTISRNELMASVTRGSHKHRFDRAAGLHTHFDLAHDPKGTQDLLDLDDAEQLELLGTLIERRPALFAKDARKAATLALLDRRLAAVDPEHPPRDLALLLELVRAQPSETRLAHIATWFRKTHDEHVRALILDKLLAQDRARLERLLVEHLTRVAGTPHELELVRAMADRAQQRVAEAHVLQRLRAASARPSDEWVDWLRLVSSWKLRGPEPVEALLNLLAHLDPKGNDTRLIKLVLDTVASLSHVPAADVVRLSEQAGAFLAHASPAVQVSACAALAALGLQTSAPLLLERLERGPRVAQSAALQGLARMLGPGALPHIEARLSDPALRLSALTALETVGAPENRSLLERLVTTPGDDFAKARAQALLLRDPRMQRARK